MSLVELHKKLNDHVFPLKEHQRLHEIASLCKNCPFLALFDDDPTGETHGGFCVKHEDYRELNDHCLRIMSIEDCEQQYQFYVMFAERQIQDLNFEGAIKDLQVARHYLGMMLRPRILRFYTYAEDGEK